MDSNYSNRTILLISGLILAGLLVVLWWWGQRSNSGSVIVTPTPMTNLEPQTDTAQIRSKVKEVLASALTGVGPGDIEIVSIEGKEWPDACLGVSLPGEICAQVITPGYLVKVLASSTIYRVHTDQSLEQILVVDQDGKVIN